MKSKILSTSIALFLTAFLAASAHAEHEREGHGGDGIQAQVQGIGREILAFLRTDPARSLPRLNLAALERAIQNVTVFSRGEEIPCPNAADGLELRDACATREPPVVFWYAEAFYGYDVPTRYMMVLHELMRVSGEGSRDEDNEVSYAVMMAMNPSGPAPVPAPVPVEHVAPPTETAAPSQIEILRSMLLGTFETSPMRSYTTVTMPGRFTVTYERGSLFIRFETATRSSYGANHPTHFRDLHYAGTVLEVRPEGCSYGSPGAGERLQGICVSQPFFPSAQVEERGWMYRTAFDGSSPGDASTQLFQLAVETRRRGEDWHFGASSLPSDGYGSYARVAE